ncbi:MAG: hypothetical protein AB2L14_37200 [Candidatus Xenobiia bacterium LiM19]
MAIVYPDAIDTWSSKTDGVDSIMAFNINLLQDDDLGRRTSMTNPDPVCGISITLTAQRAG